MSQFYDDMVQLVIELLREFGREIPFVRTDRATSVVTTGNFIGLRVDPRKYVIPGPELNPEDHRFIIDPQVRPLENDRIDSNLIVFRVREVNPAGTVLAYTMDCRYG